MLRITMTKDEHAALRHRAHAPGLRAEVRDRVEMVGLSVAGWSVPRIAQHLGCHEQTVRRYVKAFITTGFDGLQPRPHPGRPPRVTPADLDALTHHVDTTERTWTTPQLARWLETERGVRVHPSHLRALLHRRGFRWKRTKNSVAHKRSDPDLYQRAVAELATFKKSGPGGDD